MRVGVRVRVRMRIPFEVRWQRVRHHTAFATPASSPPGHRVAGAQSVNKLLSQGEGGEKERRQVWHNGGGRGVYLLSSCDILLQFREGILRVLRELLKHQTA